MKKLGEAQANHRTISDLAGKQAWLNDILEREPTKPENLKHCVQMMTLFMEEAKYERNNPSPPPPPPTSTPFDYQGCR